MEFQIEFIGYAAYIRTTNQRTDAILHYGGMGANLFIPGGHLAVGSWDDLSPVISQIRAGEGMRSIEWSSDLPYPVCGTNVWVKSRVDRSEALGKFVEVFDRLEVLLGIVDVLASSIKRKPFFAYLEDTKRAGVARVKLHGHGVFKRGKLAVSDSSHREAFVVAGMNRFLGVCFEEPPRALCAMEGAAAMLAECAVYKSITGVHHLGLFGSF